VIDAADAVKCIRDGFDDSALMQRFNISARGLQSLLKKLVDARAVTLEELEARLSLTHGMVDVDERAPGDEEEGGIDMDSIVADVRAGADIKKISQGMGFTANVLQSLFKRLLKEGMIGRTRLQGELGLQPRGFQVKNRNGREVIFAGEAVSLGELVTKAIRLRVDLSDADLPSVNLAGADLSGARMKRVNLAKANLVGADCTGANMEGGVFVSADLYGAVMYKTNLCRADLSDSNMTMVYAAWAFLKGANLSEANLTRANLSGANLAGSNFFEAVMDGCVLTGAYTEGADFNFVRR